MDVVLAAAAVDGVGFGPAVERVVAPEALDRVVAVAPVDRVGLVGAVDLVVARGAVLVDRERDAGEGEHAERGEHGNRQPRSSPRELSDGSRKPVNPHLHSVRALR